VTDTTTRTTSVHHERPPLWRNATVLKWAVQLAALAAVLAVFWFLIDQARNNLAANGFDVDYDWLDGPANFQIGEGIQVRDEPERSFNMGRALWAGMVNTLRVAGAGIIASTLIGVVMGIARLSHNWLASKIASIYIETLRNIPVLVQILLWSVIIATLPDLDENTGPWPGWLYVSKGGISVPRVFYADGFYQFLAALGVLVIGVVLLHRRLRARQDQTGGNHRVTAVTVTATVAAITVAWFANGSMAWLRGVFHGIEDAWDSIPVGAMQIVVCVTAAVAAAWWIKRFLDSRRTPAGLAKLTDDDYLRMVFAVVAALLVMVVVLRVWPGSTSWFINSGGDFWGWLGDKFGGGRGTRPVDAMRPTLTDGRFVNFGPTGLTMTPFFAAIFLGLTFYTSSFIAEIVRGGILAVPKGQSEAAAALGLSRIQSLRKVVLPQAFRVVMPPLGNQYLNITKNTSLGIAVGYSEIIQVGQTAYNKNNQTLAVFSIYMAFFLACSLTISLVVNHINRKLAIVER
jgi:general L-amino acid transport system permease protein